MPSLTRLDKLYSVSTCTTKKTGRRKRKNGCVDLNFINENWEEVNDN